MGVVFNIANNNDNITLDQAIREEFIIGLEKGDDRIIIIPRRWIQSSQSVF